MSDLGDLKGMLVLKWYSRCTFLTSHIWNIKYGKYNIAPTHSEQHNCLFHPFMCICQSQRHQEKKKQSLNVLHFIPSIIQLIDTKFTSLALEERIAQAIETGVSECSWMVNCLEGFLFCFLLSREKEMLSCYGRV